MQQVCLRLALNIIDGQTFCLVHVPHNGIPADGLLLIGHVCITDSDFAQMRKRGIRPDASYLLDSRDEGAELLEVDISALVLV